MNIAALVSLNARYRAGEPAIEAADRVIAYRELDLCAARSASHLRSLGVTPGDVVGLCLRDSATHLELLLAIARLGAVALPMDWRWTEPEQRRVAAAFDARLVLIEPGRWVPEGLASIAVDEAWHAAVAAADCGHAAVQLEDAPMLLSLTSGTTGDPKAAVVTHEQFQARVERYIVTCGLTRSDRYLSVMPLAFSGGRLIALGYLLAGATVVLFPGLASASEIVEAIARHRIATTAFVPTTTRALLGLPPAPQPLLPSLRRLLSLGAGLRPDERAAIRRRLTPNLVDVYASTGGSLACALLPEEQEHEPDSVGRPGLGVELAIVDDADQPVAPGVVGRVRYRGAGLPVRFIGAAAAGDEDLRDGWCYPGDYASMNERGYLVLRGRTSEIIKRGGIAVFAPEVEQALLAHPGVSEAAVVGVPAGDVGEEIAAFVVGRDAVAADALDEHCRGLLAAYKVPRLYHFVPQLPRNTAGKVVKSQLLELLRASP